MRRARGFVSPTGPTEWSSRRVDNHHPPPVSVSHTDIILRVYQILMPRFSGRTTSDRAGLILGRRRRRRPRIKPTLIQCHFDWCRGWRRPAIIVSPHGSSLSACLHSILSSPFPWTAPDSLITCKCCLLGCPKTRSVVSIHSDQLR